MSDIEPVKAKRKVPIDHPNFLLIMLADRCPVRFLSTGEIGTFHGIRGRYFGPGKTSGVIQVLMPDGTIKSARIEEVEFIQE